MKKNSDNTPYGKDKNSVIYWRNNRNKIKDLYKSEKYFFVKLIKKSNSFLDVGCASGGFYKIIKKFKNKILYKGLDVSTNLINSAKYTYGKKKFIKYDGKNFPKNLNNFDLTFSFGTLHHTKNYFKIIEQMVKKSKKYILFDLRFSKTKNLETSYQIIKFSKNYMKNNKILYNVLNLDIFLKKLVEITNAKYAIFIYGYYNKPNYNTITKHKKLIMASILIDKTKKYKININIKNEK
tara:strand:+ start:325 stop:1035 length:711 start_codon:yes stop_codon:yes gene_type:complete